MSIVRGTQPYRRREYKVVAVSKNANSFGLVGTIIMARDGTAYEVGRSLANPEPWKQGQVVFLWEAKLKFGWMPLWARAGCEIPKHLPPPPAVVRHEVWGDIPPLPPEAEDYTMKCLSEV